MNPIHGQPYRLQGLDVTPAELAAKRTAAQSQYNAIKASLNPFLAAYPPAASAEALKRLFLAVQRLALTDTLAILTGQQFSDVIRMGLASAIRNITLAQGIIGGPPGHEDVAAALLTSAQGVLDTLAAIVQAASVARGAAAAGARAVGLGVFGVDDATLAVIVIVGIVVGAVLTYALFSAVNASNVAFAAAEQACARDAATGRPCIGTAWESYRQGAEVAARRDGIIPDLAPFFQQATTGVLAIGGLAVAGLLAYGAWVSWPAASAARSAARAAVERRTRAA